MYLQMAGHTKVNKQLKSMRLLLRVRDRNFRSCTCSLGQKGGHYTPMGQTRHGKRLEQLIGLDLWAVFSAVWFLCFWESPALHNRQDMQTQKYLSVDEWMKIHTMTHTMEYYPVYEEGNPAIWDNMDGHRGLHAKRYKPVTERQIHTAWSHLYVESKINKLRNRE